VVAEVWKAVHALPGRGLPGCELMRGDVLSALLKIEQPEVAAPAQPAALAALDAAFWMLAAKSQAHLFQAPARAFDFSAFAPEARAFMDGPEQRLFDAMKAATRGG
jgi:hypothetical protein